MTPLRSALLDTSVVIDFPAAAVASVADVVAVSSITLAELHFGVNAADDPLEQLRRRHRLQTVLSRFEVLPFDESSAEYFGALATLVRRAGRNPRPRRLDLQIAAVAAQHGLFLITRNAADFAGLESALQVVSL